MVLTLSKIEQQPSLLTHELRTSDGQQVVFRPLIAGDVQELAGFLEGLSPRTRRNSTFEGYDLEAAQNLCDAINKYDKVRFVIDADGKIAGLLEMSLDIPEGDVTRFAKTGITLSSKTDCRFGPTLADEYQGKDLGSQSLKIIVEIAKQFGRNRIILWGGVLTANVGAIQFYEKAGFQEVDEFKRDDGAKVLDMMLDLSKS